MDVSDALGLLLLCQQCELIVLRSQAREAFLLKEPAREQLTIAVRVQDALGPFGCTLIIVESKVVDCSAQVQQFSIYNRNMPTFKRRKTSKNVVLRTCSPKEPVKGFADA
jgi:hypothetical protein